MYKLPRDRGAYSEEPRYYTHVQRILNIAEDSTEESKIQRFRTSIRSPHRLMPETLDPRIRGQGRGHPDRDSNNTRRARYQGLRETVERLRNPIDPSGPLSDLGSTLRFQILSLEKILKTVECLEDMIADLRRAREQ